MQKNRAGCEGCKSWVEEIYWKHFSSLHFFLSLPNDFHHHLVLPAKFAENMAAKLPKKVSLIGPSATMWDIELIKNVDNLTFGGVGWQEFVKAYALKEKNLLLFKYTLNSCFEVLIFELESFCEMESSYFVKQCRHTKNAGIENKKRTISEAFSVEDIEDEDSDNNDRNDSELVLTKKRMNAVHEGLGKRKRRRKGVLSSHSRVKSRPKKKLGSKVQSENEAEGNGATKEQTHVTEREQNTPENEGSVLDTSQTRKPTKRKRMLTRSSRNIVFDCEIELVHDVTEEEAEQNVAPKELGHGSPREHNSLADILNVLETADSHKSTEKNGSPKQLLMAQSDSAEKKYLYNHKSNRRKVTETEKENAYQSACQVLTEMGFLCVMRPSAVYTRCFLNIPAEWVKEHLPFKNHEVVLRMGEKTWLAMFYCNGKGGGGLGGLGWKKFAVDNFLEEFDVCHFEPSTEDKDDTKTTLDVQIFRVIPVVIPPTPIRCSKSA